MASVPEARNLISLKEKRKNAMQRQEQVSGKCEPKSTCTGRTIAEKSKAKDSENDPAEQGNEVSFPYDCPLRFRRRVRSCTTNHKHGKQSEENGGEERPFVMQHEAECCADKTDDDVNVGFCFSHCFDIFGD